MKKLIVVLMALGLAVTTYAQSTAQDTLPTAIRTDFSGKFPGASAMDWQVADSIYTATFTFDENRHIIRYGSSGKVLSHRYELKPEKFPAAVTALIQKDYPAHKIEDVDYIETEGVVTYEAELEGSPDYILVFDSAGKLLSSKKE